MVVQGVTVSAVLQCATQTSFLSSLLSLVTATLCAVCCHGAAKLTTNRQHGLTYQHGLLIRTNVFLGQSSVHRQVDMHFVNARLGPHFIRNYLLNYIMDLLYIFYILTLHYNLFEFEVPIIIIIIITAQLPTVEQVLVSDNK